MAEESALITCARCDRQIAVDLDELRGGGGGDPKFLPVLIPPNGSDWIPDPDDEDRLICGECATPEEATAYMEALAHAEPEVHKLFADPDEEGGEDDLDEGGSVRPTH